MNSTGNKCINILVNIYCTCFSGFSANIKGNILKMRKPLYILLELWPLQMLNVH